MMDIPLQQAKNGQAWQFYVDGLNNLKVYGVCFVLISPNNTMTEK